MKRPKYNEEEIKRIYNEEYIDKGISISKLKVLYCNSIDGYFKHRGYPLNSKKVRVNSRKEKFGSEILKDFSIIDKNMAYILGLIYADGWVSETPSKSVSISLKDEDKYLLEIVKNYVSEGINLRKKGNSTLLVFNCKEMFDNVNKLGLKLKKTNYTMRLPILKEEYYSHFLRGFFDGDGTVFKDRNWLKVNFCSVDKEFLEEIQIMLSKNNIYSVINTEKRKGRLMKNPDGYTVANFDMHRLFIRKQKELKKFYEYLYKNCDNFFLTRKREKFINI